MTCDKITREDLPAAVETALQECISLRSKTGDSALVRDLGAAIYALQLIEGELHGNCRRPKDQRSSAFTRYVIDEGARMVMANELKDFVVKIEDTYKRY